MKALAIAAEMIAHLPALCTVEQAAAELHCTTRHIRRLVASGRLIGLRLVPGAGSSRLLIPRTSIAALLAAALGEVA